MNNTFLSEGPERHELRVQCTYLDMFGLDCHELVNPEHAHVESVAKFFDYRPECLAYQHRFKSTRVGVRDMKLRTQVAILELLHEVIENIIIARELPITSRGNRSTQLGSSPSHRPSMQPHAHCDDYWDSSGQRSPSDIGG